MYQNHSNNVILPPMGLVYERKRPSINKALRGVVFSKYNPSYDNAYCYVGCGEKITPFNFECGHVIAFSNGGETTLSNLRPICGCCNKSMGSQNMEDFIKQYGFKKDVQPFQPSPPLYTKSVISCVLCGKTFSSNQRLQYHMNNKVCQKAGHTCDKCGQQFSRKVHLQYHTDHNVCQKKGKMILKIKSPTVESYSSYTTEELNVQLQRNEQKNIQLVTEVRVLKENPQTVNNINVTDKKKVGKMPNLLQVFHI